MKGIHFDNKCYSFLCSCNNVQGTSFVRISDQFKEVMGFVRKVVFLKVYF